MERGILFLLLVVIISFLNVEIVKSQCARCLNEANNFFNLTNNDYYYVGCQSIDYQYSSKSFSCVPVPSKIGEDCIYSEFQYCSNGLICNRTLGTCQAENFVELGGNCTADVECISGALCVSGQCKTANETDCRTGLCPPNQYCQKLTTAGLYGCVNKGTTGDYCPSTTSCDLLNTCVKGICQPYNFSQVSTESYGNVNDSCIQDSTCGGETFSAYDNYFRTSYCKCDNLTQINEDGHCSIPAQSAVSCGGKLKTFYQCMMDNNCSILGDDYSPPASCVRQKCGKEFCDYLNTCRLSYFYPCLEIYSDNMCGQYRLEASTTSESEVSSEDFQMVSESDSRADKFQTLILVLLSIISFGINYL